MGSFKVQQLLVVTLLSFIFLAGFPGTGVAVKPFNPPLDVPKGFRQLEASVVGLKFYTTPTPQVVPMKDRVYRTSFFTADTHYVWWEMCLSTKAKRDRPVSLFLWVTWQRADGTEFNQSIVVAIPPDILQPCLTACWKDDRPGGWLPGSYGVTIQIDDIQVASGSFDVLQKILKDK